MKKTFLFLIFLISSNILFSQNQNEIRASMGIAFTSSPELKDYILRYQDVGDFYSAINFSGSYGRMLSENFQLEAEVGYLLSSFTGSDINGNYDLTYKVLMPTILGYYVLSGIGYNFKFGGGAGIRFLSVDEKTPGLAITDNFTSTGYGFILSTAGNTAIATNVYAHIGADVRYDFLGKPENSNFDNRPVEDVSFNSLSFGLRLGISYQF
jgi:hypothetical protein